MPLHTHTQKFALNISSTKSAASCGFGHIYWKNPWWKTSFLYRGIEVGSNSYLICWQNEVKVYLLEGFVELFQVCLLIKNYFDFLSISLINRAEIKSVSGRKKRFFRIIYEWWRLIFSISVNVHLKIYPFFNYNCSFSFSTPSDITIKTSQKCLSLKLYSIWRNYVNMVLIFDCSALKNIPIFNPLMHNVPKRSDTL